MTQEKLDEIIDERAKRHTEQFMLLASITNASKRDICEDSYKLGLMAGMELQRIISMDKKIKL